MADLGSHWARVRVDWGSAVENSPSLVQFVSLRKKYVGISWKLT